MPSIDITKNITEHFTWNEALWLNLWHMHVHPTKEQYENIKKVAEVMEKIRTFFEVPIQITSWLRPEQYNRYIGGARESAHIEGKAVDFRIKGQECHEVREFIVRHNWLEKLNFRMENLPSTCDWIHIDIRETKGNRFFKP